MTAYLHFRPVILLVKGKKAWKGKSRDWEAIEVVEANYKDLIYGDGEEERTELYAGG